MSGEQATTGANILPNNAVTPANTPKARQLAKQLAAVERRRQAVELRLCGLTYDAIAAQLGFKSKSSAHDAVMSVLDNLTKEPAAKLRLLELERLSALHAAMWPSAMKGDPVAVAGCLRISESRRRLLGLDAPQRNEADQSGELSVPNKYANLTDDELRERIRDTVNRLRRAGFLENGSSGSNGSTPLPPA